MFYPSPIPHAELFAPESYMEKCRGKFMSEKSYKGIDDGEQLKIDLYGAQPEGHSAFAAMINYLDDQMARSLQRFRSLDWIKNDHHFHLRQWPNT